MAQKIWKFKISPATGAAKTPTVKEKLFQSKPYKFVKKLNQRSCPSAEPAKSHKKLKKNNKFCHTNESEWDAKTEAKPTTQVYTTLQNTTQGQWLRLIHFGWNKFK